MIKIKILAINFVFIVCSIYIANAQQDKGGRVIDKSTRIPLSGATILVKELGLELKSNEQGEFSVANIEDKQVTVEVSYTGYDSKELMLVDSNLLVELELSETAIDEVVVVGYGTQSKRNVTSSISSVSGSEIEDYPVLEVGQALQGKVPGAQIIQNSGSPGASLLVRIRGAGTVNNGAPLYVVDGNLGVDPIDIDPNNIESIEVLKSASAAAIYGAQGANGVVMITTKKGMPGGIQSQFNYYSGFQQVHRTLPVANATEYATLYNQALVNAGRDPLFENVEQRGEGTDWQNEIFKTAPVHSLDFSASGGSELGNFYFSAGYFNQEGIVGKSDYKRYSVAVNSEYNILPGVSVGENLSISYGVRNAIPEFGTRNPIPNAWSMDPGTPVKNADGTWGFPEFSDTNNPVAELELYHNTHKRPVINGSMFVDVDLIEGLLFRSQFNMNLGATSIYGFTPTYDIFPLQRNLVSDIDRRENKWMDWDWQNTLTFKRAVGLHNFEALGGVTAMESQTEFVTAYGQGLPENANLNPNLRYLDLAREGNLVGGGAGSYGMLSFLGRVNYDYKGKYLFTGNFRVDGSSKFGKNNRFGSFPSFSIGWRISDEDFMRDIAFVDDLKIRGGWGMLGNQNSLPNYAFANTVTPNLVYAFGDAIAQGQAAISLGNDQLKWEATNETEVGLDFSGFNNKVNFSVGYYDKKTENMLVRIPMPSFLGVQTPPFVNGGDVRNRGIEMLIGYQENRSEGLSYDVSFNFSKNKNEVTRLSELQATIFSGTYSRTTVGEPIASFYGYVMDGLFQSEEEVESHAFQASGTAPGDIRFKDLNGDGVINQEDRGTIGNPWPSFTYGLNGTLHWQNFDLAIALQGVHGNDIVSAWKYFTRGSNFYNFEKEMFDAWNGPGTSNSIPRLNVNDPNNNMRASSYFVEDGSYMRLKNLQIGYTFSDVFTKHVRRLRLYLSAQNLLTFTKYRGYDPEIGAPSTTLSLGVDNGFYSQPRIITAGINLGL